MDDSRPDPEPTPDSPFLQVSFWTCFLPIPKQFHSVEKDGPFTHCVLCNSELIESKSHYLIEKVYRRNETIIEMAICFNCRQTQDQEALSEESRAAVENFLAARRKYIERPQLHVLQYEDSLDPWLETCLLGGIPMDGVEEFQIIAMCRGNEIKRDFLPAAISGQAMEELSEVLSEKTRGWMNDFLGDTFGMPPEFCDPPSYTPVLF